MQNCQGIIGQRQRPPRTEQDSRREIAQHRAEPDTPEDRYRDDARRQQRHDLYEVDAAMRDLSRLAHDFCCHPCPPR